MLPTLLDSSQIMPGLRTVLIHHRNNPRRILIRGPQSLTAPLDRGLLSDHPFAGLALPTTELITADVATESRRRRLNSQARPEKLTRLLQDRVNRVHTASIVQAT